MKLKLVRRVIQLSFLCMLIATPFFVKHGITFITGTLYSMSIGPVDLTDPLSGFQVILLTFGATSALLVSMILPIVFTFIFGRAFCGWLCPQNLFSEFVDLLVSRFSARRLVSLPPTAIPRHIILALFVAGCFAVGYPLANLISAPGVISVQINSIVSAGTVGAETALIAIILSGEIFILRRFWCNYVCTVGTFLGFFRTGQTMRVAFDKEAGRQCSECLECRKACQLGLDPLGGKIYPLCHNCGDCIAACEKATGNANPLRFGFGKRVKGGYSIEDSA
jgi:ferredoxin-type protein NapH